MKVILMRSLTNEYAWKFFHKRAAESTGRTEKDSMINLKVLR